MGIEVQNLSKAFGEKPVLQNLSFAVADGETACIMGPSGCGKTTLLLLLLGLLEPDAGIIRGVEGRRKSVVFQENRLCENLSPVSNVRFVCPGTPRAVITDALCRVGLSDCLSQPARELSGGMKRRVALVRALLAPSDLLFLDEPFKGLDAETAALVRAFLTEHAAGKTILFVSHNHEEAVQLGARILTLPRLDG